MKNKITPSLKLLALIGTLCLQTQNVFASATSYPLVCYDNDKNQYSTTTNVSATDSSYNLTDTSGEHIIFPIVTTTNSASSYSTWATACLKKTKTLAGMSLNSTAFIVPSGVLTNSNPLKYFIGQNPSLIKKRLETVLPSLLDSTKDFDQFKKDLNRSSVTLINADGTTASKLLYSTKANQGIFNSVPSNLDSARTTLENKLVTELGLPMGTPVKAAADFIISFENQSALQSLFYQLFAYSKFGALSVNAGSGENYHTLSFSVSPNLKLLTIAIDAIYDVKNFSLNSSTVPITLETNAKSYTQMDFEIDLTKYSDYGKLPITVDTGSVILNLTSTKSTDYYKALILSALQSLVNTNAATNSGSNGRTGKATWTVK